MMFLWTCKTVLLKSAGALTNTDAWGTANYSPAAAEKRSIFVWGTMPMLAAGMFPRRLTCPHKCGHGTRPVYRQRGQSHLC